MEIIYNVLSVIYYAVTLGDKIDMKNEFSKFNISEEILKAVDGLGYKKPSEVQEKVIPEIILNKDVIVKSQTGSGKTAAFAIPICEKVDWNENAPQVLVLSPTRELAVQVSEDFVNIGRFKRIKSVAVFGKQPISEQARALKQKTHVVCGTPGRVLDHIDRGSLDVKKIKYFVIDEADEMLNMGFIGQVEGVIRRLPKNKVTTLFSATISDEIRTLCEKYMDRPVITENAANPFPIIAVNNAIPTQYAITPAKALPSGITPEIIPDITSPTPAAVNNAPNDASNCGNIENTPTD